jgi:hypothetical protein
MVTTNILAFEIQIVAASPQPLTTPARLIISSSSPMAEVGRPNGTAPALIMDTNANQNRFSIGSAHSDNSQFLVVHHRKSVQPENWASVAECTESFTFPKPPLADGSSLHSKTSECFRIVIPRKRESSRVLYVASPPGVQSTTPFLPITATSSASARPFSPTHSPIKTLSMTRHPYLRHTHRNLLQRSKPFVVRSSLNCRTKFRSSLAIQFASFRCSMTDGPWSKRCLPLRNAT